MLGRPNKSLKRDRANRCALELPFWADLLGPKTFTSAIKPGPLNCDLKRMMTEEEYLAKIKSLLPKENEDMAIEVLYLIEDALEKYPESYRLWLWKGYSIQLGPEESPYELEEVIGCYQKAIEIDPDDPEAYDDMAHFYDVVMGDEEQAKKWFNLSKLKSKNVKKDNL